jgi:hypothetical protein
VVDEGKARYVRKLRRKAALMWCSRWLAAGVAVTSTTGFFTLLLAVFLCETYNMAVSCSDELRPDFRARSYVSPASAILLLART